MVDDSNSPLSGDSPSTPPDLSATMDEGSDNGEQVLETNTSEQVQIIENITTGNGDDHQVFESGQNNQESDQTPDTNTNANDDQVLESRQNNQESDKTPETNTNDNDDQVLDSRQNNQESDQTPETSTNANGDQRDNENYPPPVTGMEFESYDDAYNYFNSYAKELGFGIRVKSSWTKRNSKEKRGAVLCCNCEGFKLAKEVSNRRKETRTGCQAMIRLRLVESNRWRVDESKLEHNHSLDPQRAQSSKSHKRMVLEAKRKAAESLDVEVRTIKLYRMPAADSLITREREGGSSGDQLNLKKGDTQVLHQYFTRSQLTNPNFFYVMDFNEEGFLRHVFWIDPRARAAYKYFGDVITIDTTCLSTKCEIPLLSFVGINHHGEPILLGCALLSDYTQETYTWLLRMWLTCMLGRAPKTIITDYWKPLEASISEVFPRAHHRYSLPHVINHIVENLGELQDFEAFQTVLNSTLYNLNNKVDEFEGAWDEMTQKFGIKDHEWLCILYEDREKWAQVYSKDTFFAGLLTVSPFFDGNVHKETTLKEFFDSCEFVLEEKYKKEALDDFESNEGTLQLKTGHPFELQLSKIYTNKILSKFQDEVEKMSSCLSVDQVHVNGSIITYMVKETDVDYFEVIYDRASIDIRCVCSCFNLRGYLCRHALCMLNNNDEEIPEQYILARWRKDLTRMYRPNVGSDCIDTSNPIQWFDHLYKRAMGVVEEGMRSREHYTVAWQAFKESLNKVRLVGDKRV